MIRGSRLCQRVRYAIAKPLGIVEHGHCSMWARSGVRAGGVRWALGVAVLLAACAGDPAPSSFRVGMSREALVAEFGEPESRRSLVKSQEPMWGPIETFWSSLPEGARVEIWRYPAAGGTVELYFVGDAPAVQGRGFAPEGAVF